MESDAVKSAIAANERLASSIRLKGVPFYFVGDRTLPPNARASDFAAAVADVRQKAARRSADPAKHTVIPIDSSWPGLSRPELTANVCSKIVDARHFGRA
jgi:hypothetical protein